ncbi:MAG: ATP-binding protein [Burkholderiaceae bacterium]
MDQHKRKTRILAVDDDPSLLATVFLSLNDAGYEILQAESGVAALSLITDSPPDLALLDISMPGMSGLELAKHLRDETTIPFMFLTSYWNPNMVKEAAEYGAVGYLVKPFNISQAIPAIEAGMARSKDITKLLQKQRELYSRLDQAHGQLAQSEKLASIGQLAAGIAHEINNPIGFVHSNIGTLSDYIDALFEIINAYEASESCFPSDGELIAGLKKIKTDLDLCFLREDIPHLICESKDGIARVRKIVQDLKDFCHVDHSKKWQSADLHKGLDSTLNIVSNEIKYKADVIKEYGDLPEIECLPMELNQVFMNLLVNASHAMTEGKRGKIILRTGCENDQVWIEINDNGSGIAPDNLQRIFAPFFTTKPMGQGTGLGLSLSTEIVKRHGGKIQVHSTEGVGTTFRIMLPQHHMHDEVAGGTPESEHSARDVI